MTSNLYRAGLVRERRTADLDACGAALVDVHERDGYPVEGVADPHAWLNPAGLLGAWVAELDSSIVGHVALSAPQEDDAAATMWLDHYGGAGDSLGVLSRLFVTPASRGHSFGERLVKTVDQAACDLNRRLVLDVMAKDQAAIRLYERLGWELLGEAEHHFGQGEKTKAYCYVAPRR